MVLVLVLGLLSVAHSCRCGEVQDHVPGRTKVYVQKGKASVEKGVTKTVAHYRRRVRVAVLNFRDPSGGEKLMAAVTDEVIRQLGLFPQVRLLERSRLREVLEERSLGRSGILRPDDLKRIGSLVPADVIVSGFYDSEKETRVRVEGRFTDITTGEILGNFTFWLRIGTAPRREIEPGGISGRCRRVAEPLLRALEDLRTPDLVESLANQAVLVPFDENCGAVHFTIIETLQRHRLFPQKYLAFLGAVLTSLDDPDHQYDRRPRVILRYFAADGTIDAMEWSAGLHILRNARAWIPLKKGRAMGSWVYVRTLFNGGGEGAAIRKRRIDEMMRLARSGKFGRPRVATEAAVLERLIRGLGVLRKEMRPAGFSERLYAFHNYSRVLGGERRAVSRVLGGLTRATLHEKVGAEERQAMQGALVAFLAQQPKSEWLARIIWKWLDEIESHIEGRLVMAAPGKAELKKNLERINEGLGDWVCTSIAREKNNRVRAVQAAYARRNAVPCSGVRGARELASVLEDPKSVWPEREEALTLLVQLRNRAKPAESGARKFLGAIGFAPPAQRSRRLAARLMGNLEPPESSSIALLVEAMARNDPAHAEATDSLGRLGSVALQALMDGLAHSADADVRFQCALLIGRLGRNARPAVALLGRVSEKDSARHVRGAASRARERIENDY